MFSRVLPKSLPQSVPAPGLAVLTAGSPKVWANVPRLSMDPIVLDSRSFAPFGFRHDLARRPPMPRAARCFSMRWPTAGDVPTKVRKTPRDLAQTRISTTTHGFLRLPKSDGFQGANFGGLIPTESWSFSSEKSYSPSRLICCQDTTEPFAMAWNRISRASGPMSSLIFWDK